MSQKTSNEVINEQDRLNKFNIGWAYYGRGNGVSFVYDRELSELFSVGLGSEFYFIDEEREFSYFVVGDLTFDTPLVFLCRKFVSFMCLFNSGAPGVEHQPCDHDVQQNLD